MLDKGAVTRINNDQVRAKQMQMPHNQAAQMSLKEQTSEVRKGSNPVGRGSMPSPKGALQNLAPQRGLSLPEPASELANPPEFDPDQFNKDMEDNILGQVRTEQFLKSPRLKDALTSIQLKEFFNQHNPRRKPDPRDLMDRVISRMGFNR